MTPEPCVYILRRPGWKHYFELHVSKTRKAMLAHTDTMMHELGRETTPYGIKAQVTNFVRQTFSVTDSNGIFAIMFVNEQDMGIALLAHECLHVAMAHERFTGVYEMIYSDPYSSVEEGLAYLLSDVVDLVIKTLDTNNHLKPPKQGDAS